MRFLIYGAISEDKTSLHKAFVKKIVYQINSKCTKITSILIQNEKEMFISKKSAHGRSMESAYGRSIFAHLFPVTAVGLNVKTL
jgi:hypothetical protein